jgi:hypothetical protein
LDAPAWTVTDAKFNDPIRVVVLDTLEHPGVSADVAA